MPYFVILDQNAFFETRQFSVATPTTMAKRGKKRKNEQMLEDLIRGKEPVQENVAPRPTKPEDFSNLSAFACSTSLMPVAHAAAGQCNINGYL